MKRTAKNRIAGLISIIVLLFLIPTVAVFTAEDDLPIFTGNEFDDCIFGPDMECTTHTWSESDQSGVEAYCGDEGAGSQIVHPVVIYYKNTDVANAEFQNKMASINESIAYYDGGCPDDATCELLTSDEENSEIGYLGYYTNYTYSEYYSGGYALLYGNYYASFLLHGFAEKMNEQEAREYYATAKECLKNIVMEDEGPDIKLTYPAGQSPKVFTKGWVFGAQCTYRDDGKEVDISDQVSWSGTGTFSPDKGSRSYPTFNSEGQNTIELSVKIGNEEYKKEFQVEAVSTNNYARVGDITKCPIDGHACPACPHSTTGIIVIGSSNVSIDGRPAARAEYSNYTGISGGLPGFSGVHAACCGPNIFWLTTGDKDVLIDGFPAVRKGDMTKECGGMGRLVSGSPGAGSKVIKSEHHTCKIPTKAVPQADEGGTISGKVTDTVETGIVGVGVTAYGETNIDVWGAITDENGEYQITGLPDDNFNIHFWGGNWAYNDGYLSSWYNGKSSMDTADAVTITGAGSVTGIDVMLAAGGSISGTVKDASGGGIEKATIGAYGESGGTNWSYTDENGEYTVAGLEDDSYQVYCNAGAQGYIGEWYNDKSSQNSSDSVTVTSPSQVSGIDFTLAGAGGISGTVKDTSGNGIEEVYVKAFGESTNMTGMGATDENGAYEILGIPDDSYRIQFQGESKGYSDQWYSSKSHWDTAEHVTVTAPNKTTGIDAELPQAGATTTTTKPQPCAIEEIYGECSEESELLRYFRDNVLSKTPEGQELIKLYYEWSPAIVKAMDEDEKYKEDVKEMLDGVLSLIRGNH